MKTVENHKVVETKFLGPTEKRGVRVQARDLNTKQRKTVSWDDNFNTYENHLVVARALLGCEPEWFSNVEGGGYLFGVNRKKFVTAE